MKSYTRQLWEERQQRDETIGPLLECYLCQTAPSFEQTAEFFEKKGHKISKKQYKKACEKLFKN